MSASYYHIGLNLPSSIDFKLVQKVIDEKCQDWLRYSPNCYVVWSTSDAAALAGAILSVDGMSEGNFLVLKLDLLDGFGWLAPWAWEWLKKDRRIPQLNLFVPPPLLPPQKSD